MSDRDPTESPAFNQDKADSLLHSARPARGPHPSLKAREVYEESKEETSSNLTALWHKTLSCKKNANETSNNPEQLNTALSRVKKAFENYKRLSEKFYSLLSHSSMEEAAVELKDFTSTDQQRHSTYLEAKAQIEGRLAQLHETTSCKSASSRHSGKSSRSARSYHKSSSKSLRSCSVRSTLSDQIVKARQKVAAAQVQAACSEREAAIKAQLEILQKSKEKEVALAELSVLEQALLEEEEAACPSLAACQDPIERTLQFVLSQNHDITVPPTVGDFSHNHPACGPEGNVSQNQAGQLDTPANRDTPQLPHVTKSSESTYAAHVPPYANRDYKGTAKDYKMNSMTPVIQFSSTSNAQRPSDIRPLPRLNPSATLFAPPTSQLQIPTMAQVGAPSVSPVAIKTEGINATELSKSMALQELITTGLYKFDDRPENYRSWRSTFKAVIKSLPVEPQAELDLLIKYSGRQSSEQVKRLKSVYIYNFNAGLDAAWERLDQDYGSPEVIESALFQRLNDFPKISVKDNHKLRELGDLLHELEIAKLDPSLPGLSYLDTAQGVNPIVARLPSYLQGKWTSVGSKYKYEHHVSFPPFSYFAEFVRKVAKSKNDPSFFYPDTTTTPLTTSRGIATNSKFKDLKYPIAVRKTEVASNVLATGIKASNLNQQCPIHNAPHSLSKCRAFKDKPIEERKSFLKEHNICFKCCASSDHLARDCKITIRCSLCNSAKHVDALHSDLFKRKPSPGSNPKPTSDDGGERTEQHANPVTTRCTEVCGEGLHSKSCSKICLVRVFPEGCPQNSIKMYAILDDQSNRSLASPEFFDLFNIHGEAWSYTLQTCAGKINTSGRRAHGFIVASEYEDIEFPLPTLIECDQLPNNREEIPTPEAARHYPHLSHIADYIPPLNKDVKILILLGRDVPRVHKIRELCNGPDDAPQAQKLDLGWVIIGEVCLDQSHKLLDVASYKTNVVYRSMKCPSHYYAKERLDFKNKVPYQALQGINCKLTSQKDLGDSVYQTTCDDNKIAPSVEDKEFIKIMDEEFFKDNSNSWVAPLPFRVPRLTLPNNRGQSLTRFAALKKTLCNKPEMQEHFLAFMQKILDNLHAEPAPDLLPKWEKWRNSMKVLKELNIPRCYSPTSTSRSLRKEIHVFCDASTEAIAAVAYLKIIDPSGRSNVGFLLGRAKLAPKPAHTIPRLELCGATLAVEVAEFLQNEMDAEIDQVKYYTDSKVVLGYICNSIRRFYVYVANRVERIRKVSRPEQWNYVPTGLSPADIATRSVSAVVLTQTIWFSGPKFLSDQSSTNSKEDIDFHLVDPDTDPEIRPEVITLSSNICSRRNLEARRFKRFSSWKRLVKIIARLRHIAQTFRKPNQTSSCHGWHTCKESPNALEYENAELFVICLVQEEVFAEEIKCLRGNRPVSKSSPLFQLNPIIDNEGMLRVGGRLNKSNLLKDQKAHHIQWPVGLITKAITSDDGRVRSVEVRIVKDGASKTFLRPVTETVLIMPASKNSDSVLCEGVT
ncbi:uncharacterized protein LOC120940698 [Rana temporaria]|uniref:uncharacterized protein LOC120940698 n=1 Tax=Rana temporaria TaxID=8407 RepID=UPI001AAD749A|nr:uncharacterized protein LOC120940698 [Rana temporaria]